MQFGTPIYMLQRNNNLRIRKMSKVIVLTQELPDIKILCVNRKKSLNCSKNAKNRSDKPVSFV